MVDESFPKLFRLRQSSEFERVFAGKVFAADEVLVITGCNNRLPLTRLGLSISRKFGNAVVRNRWKRLIREVFRKALNDLPPGMDLVVRPKRGAGPSFQAIARSLPSLTRRLANRLLSHRPESP
jgi:ribonuclease P protein component